MDTIFDSPDVDLLAYGEPLPIYYWLEPEDTYQEPVTDVPEWYQ